MLLTGSTPPSDSVSETVPVGLVSLTLRVLPDAVFVPILSRGVVESLPFEELLTVTPTSDLGSVLGLELVSVAVLIPVLPTVPSTAPAALPLAVLGATTVVEPTVAEPALVAPDADSPTGDDTAVGELAGGDTDSVDGVPAIASGGETGCPIA